MESRTKEIISSEVRKEVSRGLARMRQIWDDDEGKVREYNEALFDSEEVKHALSGLHELAPELRATYDDGTVKAAFPLVALAAEMFVAGREAGMLKVARRGGLARARKLSKRRRTEGARKAAKARWAKS